MAEAVFLDNTVLCNFAAVHRLALLESHLRGRGRWVEAVADEARRSAAHLPDLGDLVARPWLGPPVEIDDPVAMTRVEHLRRDVFGGTAAAPRKHLGEAQTCFLLREVAEWRGSVWASDDRDAVEFARFQGISTLETLDVVREIVADGDLTPRGALDLMKAMAGADRVLRLPDNVSDLTR